MIKQKYVTSKHYISFKLFEFIFICVASLNPFLHSLTERLIDALTNVTLRIAITELASTFLALALNKEIKEVEAILYATD